jgi:RNA polymerase sigma-70 factor (ECF subfamily)
MSAVLLQHPSHQRSLRVTSPEGSGDRTPGKSSGSAVGEAAIVRRAQEGDVKAFEVLVARHTRFAGAVALSIVSDYHSALDVVQEAFVKVLSRLETLEDAERFRPWLRNVVRSTALDSLRRRKVTGRSGQPLPGTDDESSPLPSPDLTPDQLFAKAELREQVREVIGTLPESQREVVMLKYLEDLSYEEISQATSLTVSTIESRLFRARKTLRALLVERFGPQGPAAGDRR